MQATAAKKLPPTERQTATWAAAVRPSERAERGEQPEAVPRDRIIAVGQLVLQRNRGTRYACDLGLPVGRRANRRGTATALAAGREDVARAPFRSTVLRSLLEWVTEACVSPRRVGALLVFTCAKFVVGSAEEWCALLGGSEKTFQRAVQEAVAGGWIVYHRRTRLSQGGADCRCHRQRSGPHREEITPAIEPGPALLEHLEQVLGNRVHPSEISPSQASSGKGSSSVNLALPRGDSESAPLAPTLAGARLVVVAPEEPAPSEATSLPVPAERSAGSGGGEASAAPPAMAARPHQLAPEAADEWRKALREGLADGAAKGADFGAVMLRLLGEIGGAS